MSRMLRHIPLCFQRALHSVGNSTRQERDMDTPEQPYEIELLKRWNAAWERVAGSWHYQLEPKCRAGDGLAIAEAVRSCRLYKQPPPDWLVDAVAKLADRSMSDQERRLRHAFAIHRERWEAVIELQERRHELVARKRELRKLDPYADIDDPGETLEKSFAAVSERLANHDAAGSAETICASYYLIEAAGGEHATLDSYRLAIRQRNQRV